MKTAAKYLATGAASVACYLVYAWGGPVHALGLRHMPGGCRACDVGTAQVTVDAISKARNGAAEVTSGSR